jgi:hypothetical protein
MGYSLGLGVKGLGFRVWTSRFRVSGFRLKIKGLIRGFEFRI